MIELHVLHHIISTNQVTEEPVVFDLLINKVAHSQRMVGGGGCTSQIVVATLELTVGAVRVIRSHNRRLCQGRVDNARRVSEILSVVRFPVVVCIRSVERGFYVTGLVKLRREALM